MLSHRALVHILKYGILREVGFQEEFEGRTRAGITELFYRGGGGGKGGKQGEPAA